MASVTYRAVRSEEAAVTGPAAEMKPRHWAERLTSAQRTQSKITAF